MSHDLAQLHDIQMFGNLQPVVFPADDDVALGGVVAVDVEVFALEL